MNLVLFQAKKNQWNICVGHETENANDEDYALHIQKKNDARVKKKNDNEKALESETVKMLTMDFQSVLLCPNIKEASAFFYKSKLACHYFTVHEMRSWNDQRYFWYEGGEEGITENSFVSCILDILTVYSNLAWRKK